MAKRHVKDRASDDTRSGRPIPRRLDIGPQLE